MIGLVVFLVLAVVVLAGVTIVPWIQASRRLYLDNKTKENKKDA